MNLVKNTAFILLALFIDGLQAIVSAGLWVIAAFPGTALGAGGGAVAGAYACSWIGFSGTVSGWCAAGAGFVLGIIGTPLNAVAPVTMPIGSALGFAINTTLSIVLGWCFLVPLMFFFMGSISWKRLVWGGGEMIPGLNNIPFWTAFVVMSLWRGVATKKERKGILGMATAAVMPVRGVMHLQGQTVESETPPRSGRELIRESEKQFGVPLQRTPLHDIRPIKPNAQAT